MSIRVFLLGAVFSSRLIFGGDGLWYIEQDFVKFGKKEVYEKYKKALIENIKRFTIYAAQQEDSMQYIYLVPVKDYCSLGDFEKKRVEMEKKAGPDIKAPFLSTLNFSVRSLSQYLPECSYVPKSKGSLISFQDVYFYLFAISPGSEVLLERQLKKIAEEQKGGNGICFRSWKFLFGSNVPKYLVAVFSETEKQAGKDAASLEFITGPMRNILLTEQQGEAFFRKDLSVNAGNPHK